MPFPAEKSVFPYAKLFCGRVCSAKIDTMLTPAMILIIFVWMPTLLITTYIPAIATFLPKLILPKLF